MRSNVDAVATQHSERAQSIKALEDARRQDQKRVADLIGEIAAVRKRADDARERTTVYGDAIRNAENRISQVLETETARQEAQTTFLAQQSMAQLERDRTWKDWQAKFEAFTKQAETME